MSVAVYRNSGDSHDVASAAQVPEQSHGFSVAERLVVAVSCAITLTAISVGSLSAALTGLAMLGVAVVLIASVPHRMGVFRVVDKGNSDGFSSRLWGLAAWLLLCLCSAVGVFYAPVTSTLLVTVLASLIGVATLVGTFALTRSSES